MLILKHQLTVTLEFSFCNIKLGYLYDVITLMWYVKHRRPEPSAEELRLPKSLVPINYDWTVKLYMPDIDGSTPYPDEKFV